MCVRNSVELVENPSATFVAPDTSFMAENFPQIGGWRSFRHNSSTLICCILYLYFYCIVTYNEIVTQLTIMQNQNQRKPWDLFLQLIGPTCGWWETATIECVAYVQFKASPLHVLSILCHICTIFKTGDIGAHVRQTAILIWEWACVFLCFF